MATTGSQERRWEQILPQSLQEGTDPADTLISGLWVCERLNFCGCKSLSDGSWLSQPWETGARGKPGLHRHRELGVEAESAEGPRGENQPT